MMRRVLLLSPVVFAVFVGLIWAAEFGMGPLVITKEYEYKIILRLGNPVKVLQEPGLWWRLPLLDEVRTFDQRLQYLNAKPVEMEIAKGDRLIIDYYAVWRIDNALDYLMSFPDGMRSAEQRIQRAINGKVGARIGTLELSELLERSASLDLLDEESSEEMAGTGVQVVDVRLNRTEIPKNAESAAFAQMREQRRALAREYRVDGEREARKARAEAEREARTTIAKARSEAEVIRGEGDAESAHTYAAAYGKDPEFYAFVRSLEAYRKTLGDRTTMVLAPDHEFFRFLDPAAGGAADNGR